MNWFFLFLAGFFEICWAVGLKYSAGFSKILPSVFTVVTMGLSVALLALAMRTLPLGTAYAIWTGIGAVGTVIFGMFFFGDPATIGRIICVSLIVIGIVGLKVLAK